MTNRKILEMYIDLEKYCFTDKEKKEEMDMLYKYKEAFCLKDEKGTCPNKEVEIDVNRQITIFLLDLSYKRRG